MKGLPSWVRGGGRGVVPWIDQASSLAVEVPTALSLISVVSVSSGGNSFLPGLPIRACPRALPAAPALRGLGWIRVPVSGNQANTEETCSTAPVPAAASTASVISCRL
eukprot:151075-Pyramimonas_sp.AAC.1